MNWKELGLGKKLGVGFGALLVLLMFRMAQQNRSSSEEMASTSEKLSGQAGNLQQIIAFLNLESTAHGKFNCGSLLNGSATPALSDDVPRVATGNDEGRAATS